MNKKKRTTIPKPTQRILLVESGFCCSVSRCNVDSALEFHHIDSNPNNHKYENLIVLCSNHHTLATNGKIDRKACREIKKTLNQQTSISGNLHKISPELRRIFRDEFKKLGIYESQKDSRKTLFPGKFEKKSLFRTLKYIKI